MGKPLPGAAVPYPGYVLRLSGSRDERGNIVRGARSGMGALR